MKVALALALALGWSAIVAVGQEPASTTSPAPYQRIAVVELDTALTADEIYQRAKRWFVDAFKDADEVIKLDDPSSHTIVGKGQWPYHASIFVMSAVRKGKMRFSIEVAAKERHYRVRFYDYRHEGTFALPNSSGLDLGLILDGKEHCTDAFNSGTFEFTPTKHTTRVCLEEVWPQIEVQERLMLETLYAAMTRVSDTGDKRGTSDW